jgi:hypothetical protein
MSIQLLASSPGQVGVDSIRTAVNTVLTTIGASTTPLTASPGQTSVDTIRTKVNQLLQDAGSTITLLSVSPNQITVDQLRTKVNEIIQAANDGTIGGGGALKFALLENSDKILIEVGGGLLLESSQSLDRLTSEYGVDIITEGTEDFIVAEETAFNNALSLENGDELLLEDLVTTLDLE